MSIHINAAAGEIAKTVLMPGDPLRAKHIAENMLQDASLVSRTRNVYFYTGTYKGKPVSVGASGMGCASIGIYSYELFSQYNVDTIIRIGTCGAYTSDLQLFDLLNVDESFSESTYALSAFGITGNHIPHAGPAFNTIRLMADQLNRKVKDVPIHCSDVFYRSSSGTPEIAVAHHCPAVEMETFALFANAQHLGKSAAALLTVSDVIPTGEKISANEREQSLQPMTELALEAALLL